MQSQSLAFLTTTLIASLFAVNANAATTVYSQAPDATLLSAPSAILNAPSDPGFSWTYDGDQERWAYFNVATNVSFNRIGWYGTNTDGSFAVARAARSMLTERQRTSAGGFNKK